MTYFLSIPNTTNTEDAAKEIHILGQPNDSNLTVAEGALEVLLNVLTNFTIPFNFTVGIKVNAF